MNMQNMLAQAKRMEQDIKKKQEAIAAESFIGESGAVKVTISGDKVVTKVEIDKNIIKDAEDIEALSDMIQIAVNDAIAKVNKEIDSKLGMYSNGLNGLL